MDTLTEWAQQAKPPKDNERTSDAYIVHEYMTVANPVTRSVYRDILISRIDRLTEGAPSYVA